jgi:hypothetical protein
MEGYEDLPSASSVSKPVADSYADLPDKPIRTTQRGRFAEDIYKGLKLGGEEIGLAGKQIMAGGVATPEQSERIKQIEKEASKLPLAGRAARYAPEMLAAVPAAFAVPEIGTAGALAAGLGLGGLTSAITKPVSKPSEGTKFAKQKLQQAITGAEETGLGFGLGTAASSLPGILTTAGRALVGTTQPEITALSKKFENLGFEFEPAQLRADKPLGSPGFTEQSKIKNENLATKLASRETGKETENITPKFLGERQKELGESYNKIFNRKFNIDANLVKKLDEMKNFETAVNPAGIGPVRSTANNIIERWNQEVLNVQQQQIQQRIQNIINIQGRGGVDPIVRLQKDWTNLRKSDAADAPAWAKNAESVIKELSDNLGLKVTPQVWFSSPRRGTLYGMATGDGHIVINDTLNDKGGLATALHEFGHQAEFQLFVHAPSNVQNDVIKAYREQMASIPLGVKTVEQHRPITADKYQKESREGIPEAGYEKNYLRDFSEWFAEQTSRWITQTKTPTTNVEKFFAKVADSWKKIYERVTGYIPLVQEVDNFFRTNWKGDLFKEVVPSQTKSALSAEPMIIAGSENAIAKIDGKELQTLRSNLTRIARTATDGMDRKRAGEFVKAIDESIGKYDRGTLDRLRDTNRKYAATSLLAEGIERGFVDQGKVSLQGLGRHLKNNTYGYGYGTSEHPLYELGYGGEKLRLRSRVEGVEYPSLDAVAALVGRSKQALGGLVGTRSQLARDLQRKIAEKELAEKYRTMQIMKEE